MKPRRRVYRLTLIGALAAFGVLAGPVGSAWAHPLGNFTVNQHLGVVVEPERLDVTLVTDMAEIPAFQTRRDIDLDGDGEVSAEEGRRWREAACAERAGGLELAADESALRLEPAGATLAFPPGQGGLLLLRLTCRYQATGSTFAGRRLDIENNNEAGRLGWREIVVVGRGVRLAQSDVPDRSPSQVLRNYPNDLLSSPLEVRRATVLVGQRASSTSATGSGASGPTSALPLGTDQLAGAWSDLVARQELTVWFGLLGVAVAILLGALHALAPGHGKTIMAAYLLGDRGAVRHAALLGLSVTATHTAGVLVLGLILSGSAAFVPERVYPWLALGSGLLLATVGLTLLRRAWRVRRGMSALNHEPSDRHDHSHIPHGHNHAHDHETPAHHLPAPPRRSSVLALGAAGGLVPSPSALVVLLGAIALGRTWFGVLLVLGYGAGMALTLVAAGLLLVRARNAIEGRLSGRSHLLAAARVLPLATASIVIIVGVGLAAQAVARI